MIVCAAIKVTTGDDKLDDVYVHIRHYLCHQLMSVRREMIYPGDDTKRILMLQNQTQGFITNNNIFVDRKEALKIAIANNQIIKKYRPFDILMSEDLY